MVPLMSLWAPILLSAVFVFVVSSIIHMALKYHSNDYRKLKDEDAIMAALRPFKIKPGDYVMPRAASSSAMKSAEFREKLQQGPVAIMTVMQNGPMSMGKSLVLWFFYGLVVSIFAAYIASRAVPPGGAYASAFRFAGCTAFTGYSLALLQNSIWFGKSWGSTLKSMLDGLIYGLLTGGVFGWLWPS